MSSDKITSAIAEMLAKYLVDDYSTRKLFFVNLKL